MSLATKKMQHKWEKEKRKSMHPEEIQEEELDLFSRDGRYFHGQCDVCLLKKGFRYQICCS